MEPKPKPPVTVKDVLVIDDDDDDIEEVVAVKDTKTRSGRISRTPNIYQFQNTLNTIIKPRKKPDPKVIDLVDDYAIPVSKKRVSNVSITKLPEAKRPTFGRVLRERNLNVSYA